MINTENILDYLASNKERILQDYHLTRIGIFGSQARGDQNESSDIDLVVEFEPNTPDLYSLKHKLKEEIQSKFNKQVDICRLKYIKPIFKKRIYSDIKYV